MKKHEPGTVYTKFVAITISMMVIAMIILGFLIVGVDASMKTIGIVEGVIGCLWIIIEASIIIYAAYDIRRTKK